MKIFQFSYQSSKGDSFTSKDDGTIFGEFVLDLLFKFNENFSRTQCILLLLISIIIKPISYKNIKRKHYTEHHDRGWMLGLADDSDMFQYILNPQATDIAVGAAV